MADSRPHCDQDGCPGVCLAHATSCLAHAGDKERDAALRQFSEGGRLDVRDVTISESLFKDIVDAPPEIRTVTRSSPVPNSRGRSSKAVPASGERQSKPPTSTGRGSKALPTSGGQCSREPPDSTGQRLKATRGSSGRRSKRPSSTMHVQVPRRVQQGDVQGHGLVRDDNLQ
jgi:hypothetical protein